MSIETSFGLETGHVLDAVRALPLHRLPLLGGDVAASPGSRVQSGSTSSTRR